MPAGEDMSSLLRITWPAQALAAQGADVQIADRAFLIQQHQEEVLAVEDLDADVVVLCRPQARQITEAIPLLQAKGVAVVVDYDDDLTAVHPNNVAWAAHHPDMSDDANWRWALEACRLADAVTVTTPALLEVYAPHGRGIVLPNRLPSWRVPNSAQRRDGPVRLGWAGWIGTHPTDLTALDGAAGRVLRGRSQPFVVVGPGDPRIQAQLGVPRVRATGVVKADEWLPTVAASLDVGIAPAVRSAFNASKSCLKSIEYAAAGVAAVASPTPDNRRAAADGLCVLVEDRRGWERALRRLLDDDEARREQVARASEGLAAHLLEPYVEQTWDAWSAALRHRRRTTPYSAAMSMEA